MKNGITVRQYAKSRGVSYEAVRRQIQKYGADLEGHIEKKNNTSLLDEDACDFLDCHRQKRTLIIDDGGGKSEIEVLKMQIARLQAEKEALKDKIIALHEEKQLSDKQNTELIEDNARKTLLLELAEQDKEELKNTKQALQDIKVNLDAIQAACNEIQQEKENVLQELNKYHKSIFGFYRKDM